MAQSGTVEIIPGKQFIAHENVTLAKLNQLGRPIGRVGEGAIGIRELSPSAVASLVPQVSRNVLFNGNFDVWQRGGFTNTVGLPPKLGITNAYEYGPDRWGLGTPAAAAHRQIYRGDFVTGQTDVPGNPLYYMVWEQTTAEPNLILRQPIEDVRTLAGKKAVLTFWFRSETAVTITVQLAQKFSNVGLGPDRIIAAASGGSATRGPGDPWRKFTATFDVPNLSGYTIGEGSAFLLQFVLPNATFKIYFAQIQLEEGTTETPFEFLPIQAETERCQRYYESSGGIMAADLGDTRTLSIPVDLTTITGAIDVLTDFLVGHAFKLLSWSFFVTKPVAVAGKGVTLNLEIDATNVGAGTIVLTSALLNVLGKEVAGAAFTPGTESGSSAAKLSVEASAVTAFTDGAGVLLIKFQNAGIPLPCFYFNVRKYSQPTLTMVPGWTVFGSGAHFSPLFNMGYFQDAPNSIREAFFLGADAEIYY